MNKFPKSLYVDVRIEEASETTFTFTLGESPKSVQDVSGRLNLPKSTVSHHLTFLFEWT